MYILNSNVESVNEVIIDKGILYYWKDDALFNNGNELYKGEINALYCSKGICIIITDSFQSIVWLNSKGQKKIDGINGIDLILDQESIIWSHWNDDYTKMFRSRFDLTAEVEVWRQDSFFGKPALLKNSLFGYSSSSLFKIEKDSGIPNWEFSLRKFGTYNNQWQEEKKVEVSRIVGVWQGQLLVLLNNGMFLGIDVETGELLWEKGNVDHNKTTEDIDYDFGSPYNPFLDEEKGVIYILQGHVFIDFDLKNQEASYKWHSKDDAEEHVLFIKQSRIMGNLIYFTASVYPDLGVDNTVGVFDIDQKRIVWKYTFPFTKGVFIPNSQDKLQVSDSDLYVLDSEGVLHIFKRQDQEA